MTSDSSRWLLARQRLRESGIPPAHERLWPTTTLAGETDDHIEAALAECTRAEANLGSLLRGLTHLTAGANAAREANTTLLQELDSVRELLGESHAHELWLRHRVQSLEQQLEVAEHDATHARSLLIEQEDLFLAELLSDHEREVAELRRRLARAEAAALRSLGHDLPDAPEESVIIPREAAERPDSLAELALAQTVIAAAEPAPNGDEEAPVRVASISTMPPPPDFRTESALELEPISTIPPPPSYDPEGLPETRAAVSEKLQEERRSGIVELSPNASAPETEPPPSRGPDSKPIATLVLRTISVGPAPLIQRRRPDEAEGAPVATAGTPGIFDVDVPFPPAVTGETLPGITLPAELLPMLDEDEITEVKATDVPESRRDSWPALKQKPDPSTRPLVGYSLGSDEVAEERVDTSRISSRPPTRS